MNYTPVPKTHICPSSTVSCLHQSLIINIPFFDMTGEYPPVLPPCPPILSDASVSYAQFPFQNGHASVVEEERNIF